MSKEETIEGGEVKWQKRKKRKLLRKKELKRKLPRKELLRKKLKKGRRKNSF
ncbi:hypothetical protein BMS3Abin15_00609 [bacterium BMS3Abin15]|nr:hypothetical protein BMS3Abin15_00609 [bacterium BMS3Abin15]